MRLPFWMRLVRRLVCEQLDLQEHNDYLARTNDELVTKNSTLSIEAETLRMRVEDLNGIVRKLREAPAEVVADR